ncbi:MAG: Ldh family oxidoreductase [Candidatus Latescibacteria bacterium]|nr:Ldh family oxidoreductase [Candidatus Latescibacterota bacterium]
MPSSDEALVDAEDLRAFSSELFQRCGVPGTDADLAARMLVESDLRGVHSHGTRAQPGYLHRLKTGAARPVPDIRIITEGPAYAIMEGDEGLGQVVAHRAMSIAIDKARGAGIATVSARNSNHYGAAAYYAMMAAREGMIGFATTNGPGVNMAPFGGAAPVVGNSPLAYAIPAGEEPPIVLDMATGWVAAGRIGVARMRGEKIPVGWGMTKDGEDTDDPAEASIVLPMGPKGYGLAIIMDILSGPLSGGLASCHKPGRPNPDQGHLFWALDVARFTPLDAFRAEIDRQIRTIRATKPRRGFDRVYLPGEIEWIKHQERLKTGIPLHRIHLGELEQAAGELGVKPFWKE